jgi:hypothetical protein
MASKQACQVSVPSRPSSWPGWDELAVLPTPQEVTIQHGPGATPEMTAAVDGAGTIYLAQWNPDGFAVWRDQNGRWQAIKKLVQPSQYWAFAVDPDGSTPLIARASLDPSEKVVVEVSAWDGANWKRRGDPFAAGSFNPYVDEDRGRPMLTVDADGHPVLLFEAGEPDYGLQAYRWLGTWTPMGASLPIPAGGGYLSMGSGPGGGMFAASVWDYRASSALGCHDRGIQAALFDGAAWRDLGEMKLRPGHSDISGCPLSVVHEGALAADGNGNAWLAWNEDRQVHVSTWTGTKFVRTADWADASAVGADYDESAKLSLSNVHGGLWLTWTMKEQLGWKVVLYRLQDAGWQLIDELHSTSSKFGGWVLCADPSGNPVLVAGDEHTGRVLYRRR